MTLEQPLNTRRRRLGAVRRAPWPPIWPLLPLAMALALSACAGAPPAPRLLRWPTLPVSSQAVSDSGTTAQPGAWQLMPWGALPDWMDRTEVLVADGDAGQRAWPGVRWAEPLRDALPRLLARDLAAVRAPQPLWTGPLPAGARIDRQLRVTLLALDNLPQTGKPGMRGGQVRLLARWSLADPAGKTAPVLVDEQISQPWDGTADGLALAQRAALWALAQRIIGQSTPAAAARP